MKCFLIIVSIVVSCSGFCQPKGLVFPLIPKDGRTLSDFVPLKWKIRDSVSGDFSYAKLQAVVLIVQTVDSVQAIDSDCLSDAPFFPKMAIVLLKNQNNSYKVSAQATKMFGDCNWGIQGHDPFEKVIKKKNSFGIQFSSGGTLRNFETYWFQFRNNDWYLVGTINETYQQGQPEISVENSNLILGIKESYTGNSGSIKKREYKKVFFKPIKDIKFSSFDDDSVLPFEDKN
jgi:hypothetical protein